MAQLAAKMRLKDRIGDLAGSLESIPEDADLLQRLLLFLVANREEFDSQFKLLSDAVREYYESRSCPFHLRTLLSSGRSDGISIKFVLLTLYSFPCRIKRDFQCDKVSNVV